MALENGSGNYLRITDINISVDGLTARCTLPCHKDAATRNSPTTFDSAPPEFGAAILTQTQMDSILDILYPGLKANEAVKFGSMTDV